MLLGKDCTAEKAFNHFDEDKDGEADYFFNIKHVHVLKVVNNRF